MDCKFECLTLAHKIIKHMKKTLRTLALGGALLIGSGANAQTPVGTLVQNFTLTDILGGSHSLYSYLDAGKTVVIDVSAIWCGPCWSYHNTNALDNFYAAHGPSGDNTAMVFWIEGDVSTGSSCLYAPGACTGGTSQGDWTNGGTVAYPIIDLATTASFTGSGLTIPYYPVMYVICPNRTVYASGVAGSIGTLSSLNSMLGNCDVAVSGTNAALNSYTGTVEAPCGIAATSKVILQNMGTNTLTSCTITGTCGATTFGPINWTGSLDTYEYEEVTLGSFTLTGPSTMNVNISTADALSTDNAITPVAVSNNDAPTSSIIIQIVTDMYGSETTWNVKNSSMVTVGSGGPYSDLGAPGTTTQPPVNLTLPANCYTITVNDSYGDGMDSGYGVGSFSVKYGTTTVLTGGDFTTTTARKFTTLGGVGIEENEAFSGVNVFPNPVNGLATVNVDLVEGGDILVNISNSVGQVLASQKRNNAAAGANKLDIDFSTFASGVYYVNVSMGTQTTVVKVIK